MTHASDRTGVDFPIGHGHPGSAMIHAAGVLVRLRPRTPMEGLTMRTLTGRPAFDLVDHLAEIYAATFFAEPWNEGPDDVAAFRERLRDDVHRPGFRAVVADDGFATGWLTTLPLPDDRAYPRVTAHLGPDRLHSLLDGALQVNELAVRPAAQGTGLGRALLSTVVAPHERAWLLTFARARAAIAFYHRVGWQEIPPQPGTESTLAVFASRLPRGSAAGQPPAVGQGAAAQQRHQ